MAENKKEGQAAPPVIKDSYYWHHYHLFHDEDFIRESTELIHAINSKHLIPSGPLVGVDDLVNIGVGDAEVKAIKDLAAKYQTVPDQVVRFSTGFYPDGMPIQPVGWMLKVDKKRNVIILELERGITQPVFQKLWPAVASRKSELGADPKAREKPPEHTELIYSIHKAREQEKLSFGQIFKLYQDDKLPGYRGPSSHFATAKLLADYYQKHKFLK